MPIIFFVELDPSGFSNMFRHRCLMFSSVHSRFWFSSSLVVVICFSSSRDIKTVLLFMNAGLISIWLFWFSVWFEQQC